MAIVAIDAGLFCLGPQVAENVRERLCAAELTDEQLFAIAAKTSGVAASRFEKLLYGPRSLLDGARRDRARLVAHLRAAVAEALGDGESGVYLGRAGHLAPPSLTHVLKVCIGGTHDYRLQQALAEGQSTREAQRRIGKDDELRAEWTGELFDRGPWEKDLYDIFIAMQDSSVDEAVEMITTQALLPAVAVTPSVEQAIADFVVYYNHKRYHESLDNVTPADMFFGRHQEVLTQRALIKHQTLLERRRLNLRAEFHMV